MRNPPEALAAMTDSEAGVRAVEATIHYVAVDSRINRRFVAPGAEHNTGRFEPHRVPVRDGRAIHRQFALDVQGFVLSRRPSAVTDFFDTEEVERIYPAEAVETIRSLTGASCVAELGWVIRTSGDLAKHQRKRTEFTLRGGVQPPAADAHVDFTPARAESLARTL